MGTVIMGCASMALLAGLWLIIFIFSADLTISKSYPDLASAQIDIEKGWIPPILPPSTYAIEDSHDLDLNCGSGSFQFDPRQIDHFAQKGMRPRSITKDMDSTDLSYHRQGYQLGIYVEDDTTWTFAISPSGIGHYWMRLNR